MAGHSSGSDQFVSGIERVEVLGGSVARLVPFVTVTIEGRQVRAECDDALILPMSALADLAGKLITAMGKPVTVDEKGRVLVLN